MISGSFSDTGRKVSLNLPNENQSPKNEIKLMHLTIQSNLLISKSTQSTTGIPVAKLPQKTN